MKPIASFVSAITAIVAAVIVTSGLGAHAQDYFKDVPAGHWAYQAVTDFQQHNILVGYPDGFFSGKRILTRYEFALAIKRAIEIVAPKLAASNNTDALALPAPKIALYQDQNFRRLIDEFGKDLALLDVDVNQFKARLNAITGRTTTLTGRSVPAPIASTSPGRGSSVPIPTASIIPASNVIVGDNNGFNLSLRYNSGSIGVLGGYQYLDPEYDGPWNRIGAISNLTNGQGPYLRINYTLNPKAQFQLGSGVSTAFGTRDYVGTLSAGMQYKLWRFASLTADWQGVYWDLSSATSGLGGEAHPFESYINLGTGINLRGNAMLKMGYQIGSFGNFSGLGGLGPSGSGQTYNAFTTQLNIRF
jgi:hypothetical protein